MKIQDFVFSYFRFYVYFSTSQRHAIVLKVLKTFRLMFNVYIWHGSAISSAREGKSGSSYNLVKIK